MTNPVVMVIVLGALSLAPFVLIMLTSFVKMSVVLSILRNALGTQQVPPNQVITGLAFVLSIFVMAPVAQQMYTAAGPIAETRDIFSESSVRSLFQAAQNGKEPLRRFLSRHSHPKDRSLFMELLARLEQQNQAAPAPRPPAPEAQPAPAQPAPAQPQATPPPQPTPPPAPAPPTPGPPAPSIDREDFRVLIPSFVTSELKESFQIGFIVFIPFLIIDIVVANILLAMGMNMLSPPVISLPFKILLFVLVDGWYMIVRGLVLSYL
ncbi:MAG: flagellar type III secretion system pore protein FliP [Bryobacteraceae bacterium]